MSLLSMTARSGRLSTDRTPRHETRQQLLERNLRLIVVAGSRAEPTSLHCTEIGLVRLQLVGWLEIPITFNIAQTSPKTDFRELLQRYATK